MAGEKKRAKSSTLKFQCNLKHCNLLRKQMRKGREKKEENRSKLAVTREH